MTEFVRLHPGDPATGAHPAVATLTIDRPPRNTFTRQLYRELVEVTTALAARSDVGAVVLFGGHEIFSAGDDLDELATLSAAEARVTAALRSAALGAVAAIGVPTVAAVTGYALGTGLGLALAADRRIAGDNLRAGCTEVHAGLVPGGGTPARLVGAVGDAAARDLVYTGRFVDAQEALTLGLVDELAAPDDVFDAAHRWAQRCARAHPVALAAAKTALRAAADARSGVRDSAVIADRAWCDAVTGAFRAGGKHTDGADVGVQEGAPGGR